MKENEKLFGKMSSHLAEYDYLTGLPNRRGLYEFYDILESKDSIHAMFIDIDNFKRVNDIYGHSMGDELLICIAKLIEENVSGFTSRIGGDEFVALIDGNMTEDELKSTAETLLRQMENIDFRKDILSNVSLSIGIVTRQRVSTMLDDILHKCDSAMYEAKYDGKNRYVFFRENDKKVQRNRNMEIEMDDALKNGEFIAYLQPKVNMISTKLTGAEALSRWNHPDDGIRTPGVYISLFEKNGFISKLDMYMFEEVCRIKKSWKGKKYEHIPVSVNMSRLHLYNKKFPDMLVEIADRYSIDHSELEIEITESVFVKDSEELIRNVSEELEKVVTIIESMISQVEHQNVTVNETAGSFRTIEDNSDRVQSQSDALSGMVKELESANAGIMDSIQTISAISEEVAAHTNNTLTTCEKNQKSVEHLMAETENLIELTHQLQQ